MKVLYEDNHLIVVNKQSGEIVQGDKTGDKPLSELVKEYLKEKYQKPGAVFLGVVHRLDRPVSGVVVFARTSKALTRLNKMFQQGEVHKTYWAIIQPPPAPSNWRGGLERMSLPLQLEGDGGRPSTGLPETSNRTSRTPTTMRCPTPNWPGCVTGCWLRVTAIRCLKCSCSQAVTTRYDVSSPLWAVPSRET